MMRILYSNISPINSSYTNLNHLFYIKKQNPQKLFLCVWDNFVFEHPVFGKSIDNTQNKVEKLQENVQVLEKLLSYLKIDYKIIYLSEAMNRLFRNPSYLAGFQKILASIKIEDLRKGFELDYIPFAQISLSRINYIIADYLIAMYLPELFPEISSTQPNYYLTSERFKVFYSKIDGYLKTTFQKYTPPAPIFVKSVPVIIHPEREAIPAIEMSESEIYEIVKAYYGDKKIAENELRDLLNVFSEVLEEFVLDGQAYNLEKFLKNLKKTDRDGLLKAIAQNLTLYLKDIQKIVQKENIKERNKSLFIGETKDFEKNVKNLNSIKIKILQYCDGINTSMDISKKTGLNLSTVSTYFTHLRKLGLITDERKPKRVVDSIVIDLKNMNDRGDGSYRETSTD